MFKIDTMQGHERMSTQDLLLAIGEAVRAGETDFDIMASGQHDIGGPLWHPEGKELHFHVTNAGQRVGSMCLPGTVIEVDESASADVGWLNAGGKITVRGDAGDTAGHCSSAGKIYIGGRAGTRTGSLMKHDPVYEEPELWVLKNVGSFSFEFMGGGKAIVCGVDSAEFDSVLGERPCVGMVGGAVYVRGKIGEVPKHITVLPLDDEDIAFLSGGMDDFLASIRAEEAKPALMEWNQWKKLRPETAAEKAAAKEEHPRASMEGFRKREWVQGGIFGDIALDDFEVKNIVNRGLYRLRVPTWANAQYAAPCEYHCPTGIPTQKRYNLIRQGHLDEACKLVLAYTPFPGSVCGAVCPNPCMEGCTRGEIDEPIQIGALGYQSVYTQVEKPEVRTGKHIAVIGGGVAGLSAAWQLARKGHDVTVYDEAARMGGKLEQVIPRGRLPHETLETELKRMEAMGVKFVPSYKVDAKEFKELRSKHDAVIVATGGHKSRVFPWEGKELLTAGCDFLKKVNRGEKPKVGKRVLVIGCGNSGMDTVVGAYEMGAERVIAVDVAKPAAFQKEIAHAESLGAKLVYPFVTERITKEGVYGKDGRFIAADEVIVSIGEEPILDYLPDDERIQKFRGAWLVPDEKQRILPDVFVAGDVVKPGQLTDAIGHGIKTAYYVDAYVMGEKAEPYPEKIQVPKERLGKEYFRKCHHSCLPDPKDDDSRCVSCGTCRDCKMCEESCPEKAIHRVEKADGTWEYISNPDRCIGCGICAGVCPCGIWEMNDNPEKIEMYQTGEAV